MKFVYNRETKETDFVSTLEEINSIQKVLYTINCDEGLCSACPLDDTGGCLLYRVEEFLTEQRRKLLRQRGK